MPCARLLHQGINSAPLSLILVFQISNSNWREQLQYPKTEESNILNMVSTDALPGGDVSKGHALIIAICVVVAVTLVVVILRCAVRIWVTRNIWWDDWMIILAMVSASLVISRDTDSNLFLGGQPYRRRLGVCGSTLRFWQTRSISYDMANH